VRALHNVHAAFLSAEAVLVTYLVHRLGGVAWVGILFYLFTVMYANFFLPKYAGYVVTAIAVGGYVLVALLEYFGILPHIFPFSGEEPPYRDIAYVLATILVGGVGFYSVLAFTVRAFAALYERKNLEILRRERALAKLSAKLLTAQEEERRRIARRIHDEVGQILAAARWALAAGEKEEAEKLLAQGIEALRDLARELRPPLLDEAGLAPALRKLLANFSASGIAVDAEIEEARYPELVETVAFRVIQEALENVRRHAQARQVFLRVEEEEGWLLGEVRDDGKGFDPERTSPGLGLSGMREWVELLGGKLSGPGSENFGPHCIGHARARGGGSPGRRPGPCGENRGSGGDFAGHPCRPPRGNPGSFGRKPHRAGGGDPRTFGARPAVGGNRRKIGDLSKDGGIPPGAPERKASL